MRDMNKKKSCKGIEPRPKEGSITLQQAPQHYCDFGHEGKFQTVSNEEGS